jgi:signal peptidase I
VNLFKKPAPKEEPKKKKGMLREWLETLAWAGGAALVIRLFIAEPFVIPTGSMESSLLVGDFLLVSKYSYGTRLPMAPLSLPFVHNKLPYSHVPSYIESIRLPYFRLPGLGEVERNDIVVFNYPADDVSPIDPLLGPVRIPSMKENYVKRCVAIGGDTFSIRRGQVYINGKPGWTSPDMQYRYRMQVRNASFFETHSEELLKLGLRTTGDNGSFVQMDREIWGYMRDSVANVLRGWEGVVSIDRYIDTLQTDSTTRAYRLMEIASRYPFNAQLFPWTIDDFGPLVIPKRDQTIALTPQNIDLYRRCIEAYEHNTLRVEGSTIYINEQPATAYTFRMNYYFMMGDNRYNSQDSRFWGMVPEDHIVGKPLLVIMSSENGFRWNRLFKKPI